MSELMVYSFDATTSCPTAAFNQIRRYGATSAAHEGFNESSEEWLTNCFNDPELQIIYEDMNASGVSDIQTDTMEVVNSPPECEITMVKSSSDFCLYLWIHCFQR